MTEKIAPLPHDRKVSCLNCGICKCSINPEGIRTIAFHNDGKIYTSSYPIEHCLVDLLTKEGMPVNEAIVLAKKVEPWSNIVTKQKNS